MIQKQAYSKRTRWLVQATGGLLLTGAGLSMAIDAGLLKFSGGAWFWYGSFAVFLFQAGLCLLIDAARFR